MKDPELIDVSVSLLRAKEGSRAESWLSWWTERVSFREDPFDKKLIEALEIGLDYLCLGLEQQIWFWRSYENVGPNIERRTRTRSTVWLGHPQLSFQTIKLEKIWHSRFGTDHVRATPNLP